MDENKPSVVKRAPVWVFPLALFPLGLGLFITGGNDIREARRSLQWTAVPGVIQESRLARHFPVPAQPAVTYRYEFEGRTYVGYHVWPGDTALLMPVMSESASRRVLGHFPEGARVTVYVNPAAPSETALIPGPTRAQHWMLVFTFFFLLSVLAPLGLGRVWKGKWTGEES